MQPSPRQSLSSLVNFQLIHSQLIISFTCSLDFCYLPCNIFSFTAPLLSFISAALNRLYSASVFPHVLRSTRRRRQSNRPHWLSISQPSCPGLWRRRKAVLGSLCSMFSFRETPLLFFSHYPRGPVQTAFHNSMPQLQVMRSGITEVFIYFFSPPHLHHSGCNHGQCYLGVLW